MTIDGVLDGDRDARSGPGDPVHPDYGPRAAVTWLLLNLELDLSPGVEDAFRQDRRSGALLPDSLRKDVRKHREAMTAARRDLSPASFSPARRTAATREADRRRDMLTALRRTHDRIDKAVKRAARMLAAGTWPAWLEPTTLLPVWARVDAPPWACTVCGRTGHPPWTQAATVVHAITQAVEVVGYECAAHAGQLPRRAPQTWVDRLYRLDLRLRSRDRVERSK
jgi:hypothetical protein